jgi:hypothetical protein
MLDVAVEVEDIHSLEVGSGVHGEASMLERMVGGCGFAAGVVYW